VTAKARNKGCDKLIRWTMVPQDPSFVDVPPTAQPPPKTFLSRLGKRVQDVVIEIVGTVLMIAGIAIADHLVRWWLGEEKFFGKIPVQWIFDLGHICVVLRFIFRSIFPEKD